MAETTVTVPRDLATAALAERQDLSLRLWLVARHLDARASGHVALPAVVAFYQQQGIGSARHVAAQVERGAALGWWSLSRDGGELYLSSTARAFAAVGAPCVSAVAVEIPLSTFPRLELFRATLYAAYFTCRQSGMFSRAHLCATFRRSDRCLARWEKLAHIQVETCIAVASIYGDRPLPWSIGEPAGYSGWYQCRQPGCAFKSRHARGIAEHYAYAHAGVDTHGLAARAWAAKRLPNRYETKLSWVRKGVLRVLRGRHLAQSFGANPLATRTSRKSCARSKARGSRRATGERDESGKLFVVADLYEWDERAKWLERVKAKRRAEVAAGTRPAGEPLDLKPKTSPIAKAGKTARRLSDAGQSCYLDKGMHDRNGARLFDYVAAAAA